MSKHWAVADWHFGGTWWQRENLPKGIDSSEQLTEYIITAHNQLINKNDVVWVLGDACMTEKSLDLVKRIKGNLILITGNHDVYSAHQYLKAGFQDVRGCKVFPNQAILTHIPIHPQELRLSWGSHNIHGHCHADTVDEDTLTYTCVSLEHTNYKPISLDTLIERKKEQTDGTIQKAGN